jgi:predicted O-methyltransferase YrrM
MNTDVARGPLELLGRDVDPHAAADLATIDDVEGWLSLDEAGALRALAMAVPSGLAIVEVGTYRGRSAVALALGALRGSCATVYAVDPHASGARPRGGRFGPEDRAAFYANVTRAGVGANIALIGLDSVSAARAWTTANVGLFFLDGDHRYEAVRADFAAWSAHLAPGASIAFDDCDFADVARVVAELVSTGVLRLRGTVGKLSWFERV